MNRSSRIAIIGCGAVVEQYYLPALRWCQNVSCEILIDRDLARAQSLAKAHGIKRIGPDVDAAADLVDGVIVAVPNHVHVDVVVRALRSGLHVLCEKPLARNINEVNSMLKVAADCRLGLFAAMVCRRYPAIREAVANQMIRLIGDLERVEATYGFPLDWPVTSPSFYDKQIAGGGAMLDRGSHLVDALLYVLGYPSYEILSYRDDAEAGVESEAEAHIRLFLTDGLVTPHCALRVSRLRKLANSLVFRGKHGVLETPLDPSSSAVLHFQKSRWTTSSQQVEIPSCFAEQIIYFGKAIQGEESSLASAESQLHTIGLIESLYSIRQPLTFPWDN